MAEFDNSGEPNGDFDDLAADYVLGILHGEERAAVERQMASSQALRVAIGKWQTRLAPLLEAVPPAAVPAHNLDAIMNKIDAQQARGAEARPGAPYAENRPGIDAQQQLQRPTAQLIDLQKRVTRWRRAAMAGGAIAASLIAYVGVQNFAPIASPPPRANYVAVLQSADKTAHFVASVDLKNGRIDILRMGTRPRGGKSFELWAVGGGRAKPQSLGLIDARASLPVKLFEQTSQGKLRGATLAVSLEPAGGSPTGQPTGPVLFTGKLIPFAAEQTEQ